VLLHAALIHQVTKPVGPGLKDHYSDTYTELYGTPVWLHPSEMADPPKTLNDPRYAQVAGRDVFETLREARRFLVDPLILAPLS
jgi:hypothetical protein